jgi:hypothetical protein
VGALFRRRAQVRDNTCVASGPSLARQDRVSWTQIKAEIHERHEHAYDVDENEVRVVLAYTNGQRVALVIQDHSSGVIP